MIENVYIVSLLALSFVLLALGFLYLFLKVPNDPKLEAYRKAAKAMAFTYFFFGVVNFMELIDRSTHETSDNALLFRMVTLIIASAQAFSFTFAMVSLVNTKYMTAKRSWTEVAVVLVFIALGLTSYLVIDKSLTSIFAYFYTIYYFSQLIRYTLIFRKTYRQCLIEIESYFSDYEEKRLDWINFSFFTALGIGLIALIFTIFPYAIFGLITSISCLIFYVYFAIRFVNYVFVFNILEDVITEEPEEEEDNESLPDPVEKKSVTALKKRINKWVVDKHYCQTGVTIKDLALYLGTNTKYLSLYINNNEGKTFRNWIGALRIEEAQRLIQENPSRKIDSVAEAVGYAHKAAFLLQFAKHANMTPGEWKRRR
ncbi:MAG: helix-turn-helix domain-containing protein [Dysgonamonadaceae bacterium]|jgi:AraC-like DNA-binding protein|nr:helix-turn-helix domain-containing protein [Dysgonamonadaceae bacterium]